MITEITSRLAPLTAVPGHSQSSAQRPVATDNTQVIAADKSVSNEVHEAVEEIISQPDVEKVVSDLNAQLSKQVDTNVRFSIDEGSGHFVVKVVNSETQEVIRQFPPDEFLALSKHIGSTQGFVLNEHV